MSQIRVIKNNGQPEIFDREKLRSSLLKANASIIVANEIIEKVEKKIKEGMTTSEIYKIASKMMQEKEKGTALRYSIRRSLLTLGPTGFPFEKFMERIFIAKGYKTKSGVILRGKCVEHEIDLLAYNKDELALVEVKFHNTLNIKTDTKVALYVKARYDDLKEQYVFLENNQKKLPTRGILITNTKFTNNAEKYAFCINLGMISWDYPQKGNLYDLISETNLIPITALTIINKSQKDQLIKMGYICCDQIQKNPEILKEIGLNKNKIKKTLEEIRLVGEKQNLN